MGRARDLEGDGEAAEALGKDPHDRVDDDDCAPAYDFIVCSECVEWSE